MSGLWALVKALLCALGLTIAIEVPLSLLFVRQRTWQQLAVVALAQVVTNPAVELIGLVVGWSPALLLSSAPWLVMLGAEFAAWVIEALLYRLADVSQRPWLMSAVLNAVSFAVGLALWWCRGAVGF